LLAALLTAAAGPVEGLGGRLRPIVTGLPVAGGEGTLDDRFAADDPDALRQQKVEEFRTRFASPFIAAEHGFLDDVIEPRQTRPKLIRALRMLENKVATSPPKKHGNIPL
jgi:propionyl-CoA carboxylase beta chain